MSRRPFAVISFKSATRSSTTTNAIPISDVVLSTRFLFRTLSVTDLNSAFNSLNTKIMKKLLAGLGLVELGAALVYAR